MTWTMLVRDSTTGSLAFIGASAAPSIGKLVPTLVPGLGAICSQGKVNPEYGKAGMQMLEQGEEVGQVVEALTSKDAARETRQLHVMDMDGLSAGFTGASCGEWAGEAREQDISLAGNLLAGKRVLDAALQGYRKAEASNAPLDQRLMAALAKGESVGGDKRGTRSVSLIIAPVRGQPFILNVDNHADPLNELRRLHTEKGQKP